MSIAISKQHQSNLDASRALLAAEGKLTYASIVRSRLRRTPGCDSRFVFVQITHFSVPGKCNGERRRIRAERRARRANCYSRGWKVCKAHTALAPVQCYC
jgi:hypothetical protein